MGEVRKPLLSVLAGNVEQPPPVWLMCQAGQYLLNRAKGIVIQACPDNRMRTVMRL